MAHVLSGGDAEARAAVLGLYGAAGLPPPMVIVADELSWSRLDDEVERQADVSWIGRHSQADVRWISGSRWVDDGMDLLAILTVVAVFVGMTMFPSPFTAVAAAACMLAIGCVCVAAGMGRQALLPSMLVTAAVILAGCGVRALLDAAFGAFGPAPSFSVGLAGYVLAIQGPGVLVGGILLAAVPYLAANVWSKVAKEFGLRRQWKRLLPKDVRIALRLPHDISPGERLWASLSSLAVDMQVTPPARSRSSLQGPVRTPGTLPIIETVARQGGATLPLMVPLVARLHGSCDGFVLRSGLALVRRRAGVQEGVVACLPGGKVQAFTLGDVPEW